MKRAPSLLLLASTLVLAAPALAANPIVRVTTPVGSFDIELCEELSALCLGVAPNTVANFLSYVDAGGYTDTFVHRSVPGFVIQGGTFIGNHVAFPVTRVDTHGVTVDNEFNQSNVRGTVAVPLASDPPGSSDPCATDPNSGSSGWFVSVADNSGLDCGHFTVFGVVVAPGMDVVDTINGLFRLSLTNVGPVPLDPTYDCMPNAQQQCTADPVPNFIYTQIERLPEPGAAAAAGGAALALAALAARRRA